MTDYRLHYAPDNASLIIRLALEELGQPYETVLVDRSVRAQKSPEYRAINPAGLVPALETPDGVLFETGAILLWLTERHAALAPTPGTPARAGFLKWLLYVSNTFHPALRMIFYPEQYVGTDHDAQTALRAQVQANLHESLGLLETLAGEGHDWFGSDTPAALDFYVAAGIRWLRLYPVAHTGWLDLAPYPQLRALLARLETRDSVAKIAEAEGLGPHPFTAPQIPNPPEGVPL